MTHIKLYLIDNDPNRHDQLDLLAGRLGPGEYRVARESKSVLEALLQGKLPDAIEGIWRIILDADFRSIVLMDFNLNIDESQSLANLRMKLAAVTDDWAKTAETYLGNGEIAEKLSANATAIVACCLLKARGVPVIIISSNAYQIADELKTVWRFPHVPAGRTGWPSADGSIGKIGEEIRSLERHTNPQIRQQLALYSAPISQFGNAAWGHERCPEEVGLADGSSLIGGHAFRAGAEGDENKALHLCDPHWGFYVGKMAGHRISRTTLKHALNAMALSAEVDCEVFRFPVEPGIAFLISFKELLISCDKGNLEEVSFFSFCGDKDDPTGCGLRIAFKGREEDPSGYTLLAKSLQPGELVDVSRPADRQTSPAAASEGESPANVGTKRFLPGKPGSLVRAIWNLGHCRCAGIRAGSEEWAQMFLKGTDHWAAWPSIEQNSVTFRWTFL